MRTAVYPGSFDPVTNGHFDIICRASKVVDKLIVAPLINFSKKHIFPLEERCEHIKLLTNNMSNVIVKPFDGLLVDFARGNNIKIIIRGLRAVTDFEYEFQMALANRNLAPEIETLFISASLKYLYLSSGIVKEIASLGGDVSGMVPDKIKNIVFDRLKNKNRNGDVT